MDANLLHISYEGAILEDPGLSLKKCGDGLSLLRLRRIEQKILRFQHGDL